MGLLFRGTAVAVAFFVTAGPTAAHAVAPAGRWSVVHNDRRDSYDAVTVTPGGAVWVAGTRHPGQISELTDVAVDGETGRVMAVGWVAWPCGSPKHSFCGETLLLSGYPGGWNFEVRGEPGIQPRAQAEPDGRGGAWVVYDAKGGGSGFLHIGTDGVEPGAFPAPPNRNASVRDLAIQPESGSVWAVGAAPSGRGGVIWAHTR